MGTSYPPWLSHNSKLMDSIYDMSTEEEEYIAAVLPHLHHEYALFSTGCKLIMANAQAVLPTDRDIFEYWESYNARERVEMMMEARNRPDPRLSPHHFELRPGELEAFEAMEFAEATILRYYLTGRKIQSRTQSLPNSQTMLEYWRENFRPVMDNAHHPEAENLGTYIQYGKHHTERRDRKAAQVPPNALYQDHAFLTTARKAATENDIKHVNETMGKFQPDGWRWVSEKMLYNQPHVSLERGGYAERSLHLFTLLDDKGIIRKRMTVKIIGDDDIARLKHTMNCEIGPHNKLTKLKCPNIVELYESSFRGREVTPHLGYIYMEHAPFGDLHTLVRKLRNGQSKQIPEPYLWIIFRALAEALHAMQTGRVIEKNASPQVIGMVKNKWRPVINPDIKLANVVLGAAKDNYYPAYLTAKIIDFGQVFSDNLVVDELVKHKYRCGTERICPPEQVIPCPELYKNVPIGVHSEIYSLGLIMCSLTQGVDKTRLTPANPRFPPYYNRSYSVRLEGLITGCLQDEWKRRPALPILLAQIDAGLASWERAYGSANKHLEELPEFMRFEWGEEEYPIGSKAPEDWGRPQRKNRDAVLEVGEKAESSSEALVQEETPSKKRKAIILEQASEQARKKVCNWRDALVGEDEPPISPPPLRDLHILHCYKGDAMLRSDSSSDDDEEFGFRFRRRSRMSVVDRGVGKAMERRRTVSREVLERTELRGKSKTK